MHVQVRFCRAAGVAHVSENLPGPYMIAYFDRNRARSHMGVKHIAIPTDINDDVIPARIYKIDIHCKLARVRNIFRKLGRRLVFTASAAQQIDIIVGIDP